jgi:ubiquinone/menaquinone biosynthesis C-methylase UbiE
MGKAIDIGCGNGALTVNISTKFREAQVIGIDFCRVNLYVPLAKIFCFLVSKVFSSVLRGKI